MILDATDRALLRLIQKDATQPTARLGEKLGLSQPATWRRIKRLH
ncbi:MAG: Lrp/AsnC family leucine-responsive transcriptional regulator, partial [Yoonia sp.]